MEPTSSSPDIASSEGGYPQFADGDVLIVDGLGHNWKLHSTALANASRQFAQIFEDHEGRVITTKLKATGKLVRWKLEMIQSEEKPDARFRSFRVVVSYPLLFVSISDISSRMGFDG